MDIQYLSFSKGDNSNYIYFFFIIIIENVITNEDFLQQNHVLSELYELQTYTIYNKKQKQEVEFMMFYL